METHAGDESIYVLSGALNIHVPDAEGQVWFELNPRDGFYIPAGYKHQYYNMGQGNAEFVFGIAPGEMGSFGTAPSAPCLEPSVIVATPCFRSLAAFKERCSPRKEKSGSGAQGRASLI